MTTSVLVLVGDTMGTIGKPVVAAWHRAERGERTGADAEVHIGFETWETKVRILSPKRLELPRHVHFHPAKNIRALATSLGRDYRRVHEDVEAPAPAGLLARDRDGARAE